MDERTDGRTDVDGRTGADGLTDGWGQVYMTEVTITQISKAEVHVSINVTAELSAQMWRK